MPGLGEASTNHQLLRDAEKGFGGDQVMGAKTINNYGGGTTNTVPARRLSDARLDPVRHTFVEPEGWADFRTRTQGRTVLVLRAADGAGRWTMAVRLLHSRGLLELYELSVADHLHRLPEVLGSGGYVLVLDRDATLSAPLLSSCADRLGPNGCLVITCDRSTALDGDVQDFVVDAPVAPGPTAILQSHLRWRIGEENADSVLSQPDVNEFLTATVRLTTSRRDAAALATLMAEESAGDTVDLEAVGRRYTQRGDDELDTWFEGLPDLGMRTFAIALAVLHGSPYEDVAQAARLLQHRLERDGTPQSLNPGTAHGPVWRDPFATPNRARLARLRATSYRTVPTAPDHEPPATRVEFRDPDMRTGTLDRAWDGYQIQGALLAWLVDLVEMPSSRNVPFRAAAALGHLATRSFRFVQTQVLWPWSVSDEEQHRDVVAWALRASANDPLLRPSVESFVEELSTGNTWQKQATAAGVIGISLGPADPEAVFREFDNYAVINDIDVAQTIGRSFVNLLLDLPETTPAMVLGTLMRWSDDRKRRDMAHWVFLIIASQLVRRIQHTDPDGQIRVIHWPALLRMVHHDPELRKPLLELWRRVLNQAFLNTLAGGVMQQWAEQAEFDDDLLVAFARLVRAIAEDVRTRSVLLGYARAWRAEDRINPLPRAARAIEAVLGEPSPPARHPVPVHTI